MKPVFYNVLRNTLVCGNLDIATTLGFSEARYRCVTKDGIVVEPSGAMSGSGKPKRGGMGSIFDNERKSNLNNSRFNNGI